MPCGSAQSFDDNPVGKPDVPPKCSHDHLDSRHSTWPGLCREVPRPITTRHWPGGLFVGRWKSGVSGGNASSRRRRNRSPADREIGVRNLGLPSWAITETVDGPQWIASAQMDTT